MPAVEPAPVPEDVGIAVLTITSTRSLEEDEPGDRIVELLERAGYEVSIRELINDDFDQIQRTVDRLVDRDDVYAIIVTGGLGLHGRDVTEEAIKAVLRKSLPGIGELVRARLYASSGTHTVVDRSFAGVREGVVVCCLPAVVEVVELALEEVLLPELEYLVGLARVGLADDEV
ncbi:MAG: MogA/MoaB family molybdenum cofactor biosynthesis protein [Halobacteriota archaeon]